MSTPGGPRKTNPWPFLAISVLVLLLGTFLVLKFMKPEQTPAVVKEPVKPVEPIADTTPKAAPPGPAQPSIEEQLAAVIAEIKKAVAGKKWDDAAAGLKNARALKEKDERLDALRHTIAEGREEERKRLQEERRKYDAAFGKVRDEVDKLKSDDKLDAALEALVTFSKEQPYALEDPNYLRLAKDIRAMRKEARDGFELAIAEARAHLEAGRHPEAFKALQKARLIYPEGEKEIAKIESRIKEATLYKDMVRIPDQPCWIGSDEAPEEAPLRKVKLAAFFMDKYQVTNKQYLAFCEATGHRRPPYWRSVPGFPPRPIPAYEDHPVVFISLQDAEAYAKWAGKRLPTAEEWEVAARGPDKRLYPWGNVFTEQENEYPCNCLEFWQLNKQFSRGTTAVRDPRFANNASPWGVYGMAGNVWEYTSTRLRRGEAGKEYVVLKGGSFMAPAKAQRASNVYLEEGKLLHPEVGFRCVRDLK